MAPARHLLPLLLILGIAACDRLDDDFAATHIREQFCREWPHGCTDDLQVIVKRIHKHGTGRVVDFQLVEGADATGTVSGAYFMSTDRGWELVVFEDPFRARLHEHMTQIAQERSYLIDRLLDLKVAQDWYRSIYRSYAPDVAELGRVSYEAPANGMLGMSVPDDRSAWTAEVIGEHMVCRLSAGHYIADCAIRRVGAALGAGGTLTAVFGDD